MSKTIDRHTAVNELATSIASRDYYIVSVHPNLLQQVASLIDQVEAWDAYIDNGTDLLIKTNNAALLVVSDLLIPVMAIVVIPKTVEAAHLAWIVNQPVPADGSKDLVLLHEGAPYVWSLLLLDALEVADPGSTAQIRANALANLN